MYTIKDIYFIFRQKQGFFYNRPYKIPKDFNKYIEEKMNEPNKLKLVQITGFFNTKWKNIDPNLYFKYGFDLFGKNFSYNKFLDDRILKFYIQKDKVNKQIQEINKRKIIDSFKYLSQYNLDEYCNSKNGQILFILEDYLQSKIDKFTFIYLVMKFNINLSNEDFFKIPNIKEDFNKLRFEVEDNFKFFNLCLNKIKEKI